MSKARKFAKTVVFLSTIDYILLITNIFVTFWIVSILSPENYGIYGVILSVYALIGGNLLYLPTIVVMKDLPRLKDDKKNDLLRTVFDLTMILGIISVLVYFLVLKVYFSELLSRNDIFEYGVALIPAIVPQGIIYLSYANLLANLDYSRSSILKLMDDGTFVILRIYLVLVHKVTVLTLLMMFTFSKIVGTIYALCTLLPHIKKGRRETLRNILKIVYQGGLYTAGSMMYAMYSRLDSIILPAFLTDKELGYYFFAKRLVMILKVFYSKVCNLLIPVFSGVEDVEASKRYLKITTKMAFIIFIPIVPIIAIYSKVAILILAMIFSGILEYLPSTTLIGVFSLLIILEPIGGIIASYFNSKGNFELFVFVNGLTLVVYIATVLILSNKGAFFAASAFIISLLAGVLCWIVISLRREGIKLSSKTFLVGFISTIIMLLLDCGLMKIALYLFGDVLMLQATSAAVMLAINYLVIINFGLISENEISIFLKISKKFSLIRKLILFKRG